MTARTVSSLTVSQEQFLRQKLLTLWASRSTVIEIHVPDETIKQRVSGRRVCQGCGASYHVEYKPTKVEGVCDKCGDKTIVRKDDQPEVVLDRLATYHEKTAPLKDYYEKQGKLVTVIGQEEVAETSKLTLAAVGADK